jgi:hypothetical protein
MLLVALLSAAAMESPGQVCSDRIAFATPMDRFTDNGDGTVTDRLTALTWQRCPLGFGFDDNGTPTLGRDDRCTPAGTVTFTWQNALQAAADLNQAGGYAGFTDWRLPNIKELGSVVETRCTAPSINLAVFPGTPPAALFLSATFHVGPPTFVAVRGIDFGSANDVSIGKTVAGHVRLVRTSGAP